MDERLLGGHGTAQHEHKEIRGTTQLYEHRGADGQPGGRQGFVQLQGTALRQVEAQDGNLGTNENPGVGGIGGVQGDTPTA